jgi:hypothetical protein
VTPETKHQGASLYPDLKSSVGRRLNCSPVIEGNLGQSGGELTR